MTNHSARRSVWMMAASLSTLTACGDATAPAGGATNLSLTFAAQTSPASARVASAMPGVSLSTGSTAAGLVLVGPANDTLVVSSVKLVLGEVKLRRADVTSCPMAMPERKDRERSSDDKGCSRLDLGPTLLDLPLGEAGSSKLAVNIPAGSYREVEFELDKVESSDTSAAAKAFLAANPEFVNRTVLVSGTYKGQPFTFSSKVEAEVEMEFDPAIVVEAGSNDNITVSLDLARWFRDKASGALLVPSTETKSRIEENIATSFDAFGDRNRDGKEDEGRKRSRSRNRNGSSNP